MEKGGGKRRSFLPSLPSIIWKSNVPFWKGGASIRGGRKMEKEENRRRERDKLTPARENGVPTGCGESVDVEEEPCE